MKKSFAIIALISSVLVGCGTSDPYQKRAEQERERQEKYAESALDRAPKWMTELPKSTGAVYANGSAVSMDMSMADSKAKVIAYGKICMAAGGEVDQRSTVYINDSGAGNAENSELAVRSLCRRVDITGVETVEIKRVTQGSQFRTYVLVALPVGDANALQMRKDRLRTQQNATQRSQTVFQEMDKP